MKTMKTYTVEDIRAMGPCYDPVERGICSESWTGTVMDVLLCDACPPEDRLWVAYHMDTPSEMWSAWGRWCALQRIADWDCPDVVREWLETGNEEIRSAAYSAADSAACSAADSAACSAADSAARSAASLAADSAARSAACSAADSAASLAADSAACSASCSAADSASYSVAYSAARSASCSASCSAADSASYSVAYSAARSAACSAARSAQVEKLIKMVGKS